MTLQKLLSKAHFLHFGNYFTKYYWFSCFENYSKNAKKTKVDMKVYSKIKKEKIFKKHFSWFFCNIKCTFYYTFLFL